MNKREFIQTLSGGVLGAVAATTLPKLIDGGGSLSSGERSRRAKNFIPNVPVVTHEGETAWFYDDLIKGRTVLINFMYARCADICPGMTANLRKVQQALGDRVGRDIFIYSVTLEPEYDTPEKLKAYADHFRVGKGWTFLTGTKTDIENLRKGLGFAYAEPSLDEDKTQHTGMVKYGIEPLGRWGAAPALGNPKYIAEYVRWIEPHGPRPNIAELLG